MRVGPALFGSAAAPTNYSGVVLADSPLIYLKLDEITGTTYADSSGNGRTGTATGTITQNQAPLFTGSSKSVLFTTANAAFISFAADPFPTNYVGSLTFEVEFNCTNLAQMNALFGKGMGGGDFSVYARVNTNGSLQWGIVTTSGAVVQHDQTGAVGQIVAGTPYHAIFRWTSGVGMDIALNGASGAAQLAFTQTGLRNSAVGIVVGEMITPIYSSAKIDEFSVYNVALSDARIAAHYNSRNTL